MDVANPDTSRAVLIGTGSYAKLHPLPAIAANLRDLRAALIDPDVWGLPPGNIIELPDEPEATTVYRKMRAAATATGPDGLLLIYFAGHGLISHRELVLGLPPTDPQYPDEAGIVYAKVRDATRLAPASRRVVVLDCCYAGRADRDTLSAGDALHQLAAEAAIEQACLFVAASANTVAEAPVGAVHTSFTGTLLEVLTEGCPVPEKLLTVRMVAAEVTRRLIAADRPRPELRESNSAADVPLVRNVRVRQRRLAGRVLTAGAGVTDPELQNTRVLVLRHDHTGAMGVRLNRPGEPVPESLEPWLNLIAPPERVFDGGPMARDSFIAVVRLRKGADRPIRYVEVAGTLGAMPLTDIDPADDTVAQLRIYSGYLGWAPGSLEQHLADGLLIEEDKPPTGVVFALGSS